MMYISKEISLSYFQKTLHNYFNEIFNKKHMDHIALLISETGLNKETIPLELWLYLNVDLERKKQHFLLLEN